MLYTAAASISAALHISPAFPGITKTEVTVIYKKCQTCAHAPCSVFCVNCGLTFRNYRGRQSPNVFRALKSLSLEEMASFLAEGGWGCEHCPEDARLSDNPLAGQERCDENCRAHCKAWLQSTSRAQLEHILSFKKGGTHEAN